MLTLCFLIPFMGITYGKTSHFPILSIYIIVNFSNFQIQSDLANEMSMLIFI